MNSYKEWYNTQVVVHGLVRKPVHYKIAQHQAIMNWVGMNATNRKVLDFGCAEGAGMLSFHYLGAENVVGLEINREKTEVAEKLGLTVEIGDLDVGMRERLLDVYGRFDVIWSSHVLEHVYDPDRTVDLLHTLLSDTGRMYIILPYIDTGDINAHCASIALGLREDDEGESLVNWFEARGFECVEKKFSDFREPEIWLCLKKR